MEKISQLIDGELGEWEARAQITRLERDPGLAECWATYHLIGDALRKEIELGPEFTGKLRAQLDLEPLILAPRLRLMQRAARHALPTAAAVAGVTVVAWLALSSFQTTPDASEVAKVDVRAVSPRTPRPETFVASPANAGVTDYLVAHQEFSPSTTMHGVASYMRTVSADESNGAR
jgi:sigma-E factor negative regulatory protein RseA